MAYGLCEAVSQPAVPAGMEADTVGVGKRYGEAFKELAK
jgi:hypothetical protein